MKKPFSLSANERIKSKKTMDTLFRHGKAFFVYPYRVVFLFENHIYTNNFESCAQMGITVPKRFFKKAHDRNKLKRLSKETYRIEKYNWRNWLQANNLYIKVLFIYNTPKVHTWHELQTPFVHIGERLKSLAENTSKI